MTEAGMVKVTFDAGKVDLSKPKTKRSRQPLEIPEKDQVGAEAASQSLGCFSETYPVTQVQLHPMADGCQEARDLREKIE